MRFIFTILLLSTLGVFAACQDAAEPTSVSALPADSAKTTTNQAVQNEKQAGHEHDEPRITLEEAKKDFDAGNAIFVDTRAESAFKTEHIKGALNIPMESFNARYKEIPEGKKIIAYCS